MHLSGFDRIPMRTKINVLRVTNIDARTQDYCWYHLTQALLQFYKESCVQEGSNDESGGSTTFDKFMSSYRQQCFKSFKRLARRKARVRVSMRTVGQRRLVG